MKARPRQSRWPVRGKQSGLAASLKPLLDNLESSGFHLSDALKQEALRLAGE